MRPVPILLCAAALALAACGAAASDSAEEFEGAERAVAAAVERLEDAARRDDAAAVCTELLSQELLRTLDRQGTKCQTAVEEAFRDADSLELRVDEVKITGARATATVTSGRGSREKTDELELERDGERWRIASLRPS